MSKTNGRFRAPGTAEYDGEAYLYAGKGRTACSASYMAQAGGPALTLFYADLVRITPTFAVFRPHNYRLEQVVVRWKDFADGMYGKHVVFLVGPLSRHDENYLSGKTAVACESVS